MLKQKSSEGWMVVVHTFNPSTQEAERQAEAYLGSLEKAETPPISELQFASDLDVCFTGFCSLRLAICSYKPEVITVAVPGSFLCIKYQKVVSDRSYISPLFFKFLAASLDLSMLDQNFIQIPTSIYDGKAVSSVKQEPEGPSCLTKFNGHLSMGPACPVDTFCQAIQLEEMKTVSMALLTMGSPHSQGEALILSASIFGKAASSTPEDEGVLIAETFICSDRKGKKTKPCGIVYRKRALLSNAENHCGNCKPHLLAQQELQTSWLP
ncbi:hypothetical protein STEG23_025683 [Scotinomys teguina]